MEDLGLIPGGGALEGNFNFLAYFQCFGWHLSRDGDRKPVQTGLSIAVNQSKTGPPSKRFGFLCMHRVTGGVIKLSAPTSSLASQCQPSATIKLPFQNYQVWYPAHSHYAQKPSEHRESAQGASIYRNFQELSSSGKFSHAFHCVVLYPRNVINKPFRKP